MHFLYIVNVTYSQNRIKYISKKSKVKPKALLMQLNFCFTLVFSEDESLRQRKGVGQGWNFCPVPATNWGKSFPDCPGCWPADCGGGRKEQLCPSTSCLVPLTRGLGRGQTLHCS